MTEQRPPDDTSSPAAPLPRPRPRLFGPEVVPLIVPLLGVLGGLLCCWLVGWQTGLFVVGGAVVVAALERLVLPRRLVGLLAVRGRAFDVIVLTVLAVALVAMTLAR